MSTPPFQTIDATAPPKFAALLQASHLLGWPPPDGRVQLLKKVDQSRKQLAVRHSGDLVGEIELLCGTPRMADAVSKPAASRPNSSMSALTTTRPADRCELPLPGYDRGRDQ